MAGFMGRGLEKGKMESKHVPEVTEFAQVLRIEAGIKPGLVPAILTREELEKFIVQRDAKKIATGKTRFPDLRSL